MKMLLTSIIKALVDTPSAVKISHIQGVKSGKTVGALRTLFNSLASKEGRKAVVEVVD